MRIVDAKQVREALPMAACIDLMRAAMVQFVSGKSDNPQRVKYALGEPGNTLFLMPAGDNDLGVFGCKTIVQNLDNVNRGLPSIQGVILLFDGITGEPIGAVDAPTVTAIRTAAMSGLATQALARADASTHGILGTGVQALSHAESIACVRPIKKIVVWGRDGAKAAAVAQEIERLVSIETVPAERSADAARCDVVSTVTAACDPILFGADLNAGAHVNLVGSHTPDCREIDSAGVRRARVFVDSRASAQVEAGDLIIPHAEDGQDHPGTLPEIGEVVSTSVSGRQDDNEITLFKSLGLGIQDLYSAHYILRGAGVGAG